MSKKNRKKLKASRRYKNGLEHFKIMVLIVVVIIFIAVMLAPETIM